MQKLKILINIFIICFVIVFIFYGCMNQPAALSNDRNANETEDNGTVNLINLNDDESTRIVKYLSVEEVIKKLENKETVYYDEIASEGEEKYAKFYKLFSRPCISQFYSSYEDLIKQMSQQQLSLPSYNRNISTDELGKAVYVKEFNNSDYYALAVCNDRKTVFNENGSVSFIEGTVCPQTEKDESKRPIIFALIEKGSYKVEAENPASNIEHAEKKTVSLNEAVDALNSGHSVRLCDIAVPENAQSDACALFADPKTGKQCTDNNGMIILDKFSAQNFKESADGKVLAAEIYINYEENGYSKKAMIYAYLHAEALADCVELNSGTMTGSSFINKYSDNAAVYKITDYKNSKIVFYDEDIINTELSNTTSLPQ